MVLELKSNGSKLVAILCSTFALSTFSFANIAGAEEKNLEPNYEVTNETREEIIANLDLGNNVTEEEVESLNDAMLYELSQDSGEIVSITEQESYVDSGQPKSGISIMSMPTSDLKLTVVAQRINEKSGKDNFKFTATADWKKSPFWEFEDTIALGWSDSFTLYSDKSYMYGYVGSKQQIKPGVRNKVKAEAAVAHDVDLQPAVTDDKAVLVAKVYKNNSSGSANVTAEYGHVEKTASVVSMSFGAGGGSAPTIGFDVDWNSTINEAVPAYTSFSY